MAIEVLELEGIEVGDVKFSDTEPSEGEQVGASDPTETGDRSAASSEYSLLLCR